MKAKITVDKAWKASVASAVTFVSGESCAYDVQPGQKPLLFLYKGADGAPSFKARSRYSPSLELPTGMLR